MGNNVGWERQHVVVSFDLLQNMRFRWSRNFMKNRVKVKHRSTKKGFKKQCKQRLDFVSKYFKINRPMERPMVAKVDSGLQRGVRFGAEGSLLFHCHYTSLLNQIRDALFI